MARRKKLTAFQNILWYIGAVVRWIPILFVLAIMGWTVYAYVFVLCIQVVESHGLRALYLVGYFILMFLLLWSFLSTVLINPSPVPDAFQLSDDELDQLDRLQNDAVAKNELLKQIIAIRARNLPVYERWPAPEDWPSGIRFCHKCELIKPDRTHHCSICGRCIPKFDHHCPWVNNCVCHSNYKYFLLFLGYSLLLCLWGGFTCLPYFIRFWQHDLNYVEGKFHILFMPFVALTFALSVSGLFIFHLWLVGKNRTTIESSRYPAFAFGPDKNGYNLGCSTNFRHVFGSRPLLWFLPVNTSYGDGFSFPVRRLQEHDPSQPPREVPPANVENGNLRAADLSDVTLSSRYNIDAVPRHESSAIENERLANGAPKRASKSSSSDGRSSNGRTRVGSTELNGNGAVYSGRHGGNAYVVHDDEISNSRGRRAVPGEAVRTSHSSARHSSRHDVPAAPLSQSYQQYYREEEAGRGQRYAAA